jgi:hypothetical protein
MMLAVRDEMSLTHKTKLIQAPVKRLRVENRGVDKGVPSIMFQSKVGMGLRPRPLLVPTIQLRFLLKGAIHDCGMSIH